MGWENVFHCEINPFCQKILKYYWQDAKSYEDIKKTDFTEWRGKVDIVSGGFPCQPFSLAGKRKGTEDDRHLWPEMLRAIREIRPRWVVGENVYGIINWSKGLVFEQVQIDLENEGYEVTPYILPACGVGAPHRRNRVWFVAHTTNGFSNYANSNERPFSQEISEKRFNECWITPNPDSNQRPEGRLHQAEQEKAERYAGTFDSWDHRRTWENFPTVSPIRGRDDGLSPKLVKQCLEALGNAIVPQIAFQIFKAIDECNKRDLPREGGEL